MRNQGTQSWPLLFFFFSIFLSLGLESMHDHSITMDAEHLMALKHGKR